MKSEGPHWNYFGQAYGTLPFDSPAQDYAARPPRITRPRNCRVSHLFRPSHPRLNSPAAGTTGIVVDKREIDPAATRFERIGASTHRITPVALHGRRALPFLGAMPSVLRISWRGKGEEEARPFTGVSAPAVLGPASYAGLSERKDSMRSPLPHAGEGSRPIDDPSFLDAGRASLRGGRHAGRSCASGKPTDGASS